MTHGWAASHLAETIEAFVDVLLPGSEHFPRASAVGTHGVVLDRIRQRLGNDAFPRVLAAIDGTGRFLDLPAEGRIAAVRRLEANDPELFAFLRFATYFAYYERPPVIAAIQALGHDYNDAPQPLGYSLPLFDPAKHVPAAPRGSYKPTESISRIDLSHLAELGLPVKEA